MKACPFLIGERDKKSYRFVFLVTFAIVIFAMLPSLIYNKGLFIYYGDFNSQQLPFYQHAHDLIRQGNFGWDWGTDLGSSFIGSYSFYLLGSPFFWLTIPFPSGAVDYLIPWLLALKTGIAAVTSYAYIKRFVKSSNACVIGSLLYALSGFQVYNIFFNHFHDVTAFFPLLLIALEERVQNNRRGVFALAVGLCAIVNYFFFTGQITFLIIYFVLRCTCKDFNITFRKFVGIAIESILGVMLACVLLVPAAVAVASNPRVSEQLYGHDMVVYSDRFRLFRIIQSFFMIPDPPGRSNLFTSTTAKWASIAGYLPLFSVAGVIAFMKEKKKHWSSKIIFTCIIFAFIPVLNTSFYLFNGSYYARWYYMPILIMCMMTAYVLDNKKMNFSSGIPVCAVVLGFLTITGLLPTKEKGVVHFGNLPKYTAIFWISIVISIGCLLALISLNRRNKNGRLFFKKATAMTIVCAVFCTCCVVWYGMIQGPEPHEYIDQTVASKDKISLLTGDRFFRIDASEGKDNFTMFWGYSSMRAFNSVVSSSIMEFYEGLGITRDVASRIETSRYPLRGLLSVKYYFNHTSEDRLNMPGFQYNSTQDGFNIFENQYYIPMGFTFDYYVTKQQFDSQMGSARDLLLLKGLYLNDEQIERYKSVLQPLPEAIFYNLYSADEYLTECMRRKTTSAYYFQERSDGFSAKIKLPKENLVFFSVPYDKGFSATVNGKEAKIEKVDGGLMAVLCPAGDNVEINFKYKTQGQTAGIIITFSGAILLALYIFVGKRFGKTEEKTEREFDYESCDNSDSDEDETELTDEVKVEGNPPKKETPDDEVKPQ